MRPDLNKASTVKTQDLQIAYQNKMRATFEAQFVEREARAELQAHLVELVREMGLGRDALVEHIHADAHFGKPSDKAVTSLVRNVFPSTDGKRIMLRVKLGSVRGGLSSNYGDLAIEDVQHIITPSSAAFA